MKRLLLITLFFIAGYFVSATPNPLSIKATLVAQNEPLENVLATLTTQTGVRFSYNSQLIDPQTKVTMSAQDKTIEEILTLILPETISFKNVGEHVIFYQKTEDRRQKTEGETNVGALRAMPTEENRAMPTEENNEKKINSNNGTVSDNCLDSVSLIKDTINFNQTESMKAQIAALMMAAAIASTPVMAQDTVQEESRMQKAESESYALMLLQSYGLTDDQTDQTEPEKCRPFQITFIYPLGTGFTKSAEKGYHVSLNVLGGTTGYIKGFEAGSLFNINKYGAIGAQFAGLFNITAAGRADMMSRNVQFGGLFNITRRGTSVQFGGIFNIGDTTYFQAGGIFNTANQTGAQFAGIFNHANTAYFQAAGIFNHADKSGAQLAGIGNHGDTVPFQAAGIWNSVKETKCQLAGIANIAQESVCQIAGIFNKTKKGRFQMGLINVRDTADGVSLGLINIVKHGGVLEAGIEASEFVHTAVTFRSGVQRLYSIISVGYNYTEKFWSAGAGLGTSFKLVGNLGLNLELTYASLYKNHNARYRHHWYSVTQFSPMLNYRFAKHFKIYAGPSLNLLYQSKNSYDAQSYLVKAPYSIYHKNFTRHGIFNSYDHTIDLWIGVVGGIKF